MNTAKLMRAGAMACALTAVAASSASAEAWESRFDDGTTQGWTAQSCAAGTNPGIGGNPGGYLKGCDNTFRNNTESFAGNYGRRAYALSFDLKNFGPTPLTSVTVQFLRQDRILGAWIKRIPVPPGGDGWGSLTVEFDARWSDQQALAAGWINAGPAGATVSWTTVMDNVEALWIVADPFQRIFPNVGLDNVVLRTR